MPNVHESAWSRDTWEGSPADGSALDDSYAEGDPVTLLIARELFDVVRRVLLLDDAGELLVARAEGSRAGAVFVRQDGCLRRAGRVHRVGGERRDEPAPRAVARRGVHGARTGAGRGVVRVRGSGARGSSWIASAALWPIRRRRRRCWGVVRERVVLASAGRRVVNATTFVPALMPLAPSSGKVVRFPAAMAEVLGPLGMPVSSSRR